MHITKYTSIKPVIERVYADTGFQFEIPHDDLILWTVECMELVGNPLTYIPKVYGHENDPDWDFTGYRVPLPCDFHKLNAIAVNGFPAYYRSNSFHYLLDGGCCGFDNLDPSIQDTFLTVAGTFSPQAEPLSEPNPYNNAVTFDINDSYVTFNVESGKACMAYWAFPVDEDGFPIIPDDAKYRRAVQDYLIYKVDYRLWRQGFIDEKVFRQSENNWLWSIGSVSSHLKMPDVAQMETLKSTLTNLIPKFHSYSKFFKDLSINKNRL
jgi:hypothetical protein